MSQQHEQYQLTRFRNAIMPTHERTQTTHVLRQFMYALCSGSQRRETAPGRFFRSAKSVTSERRCDDG